MAFSFFLSRYNFSYHDTIETISSYALIYPKSGPNKNVRIPSTAFTTHEEAFLTFLPTEAYLALQKAALAVEGN